jgi:hypothetical protein
MSTAQQGAQYGIATQSQRGVTNGADMMGFLFGSGNPAQNFLMNGACELWQRGTSFSNGAGGSGYTADRWYCGSSGSTSTFARSTDVPSGFYGYSIDGSDGANTYSYFSQRIEAANCKHLVGKTITASFWIKTANPETIYAHLGYANSEDNFGTITQIALTLVSSQITANQWSKVTVSYTVPTQAANGMSFTVYFNYASGASRSAKVTGFTLNVGSIAQPFSRAGGTIGGELALCQRYYEVISLAGVAYRMVGLCAVTDATNARLLHTFAVDKRTSPYTLMQSGSFEFLGGTGTYSTMTLSSSSSTRQAFIAVNGSGMTSGQSLTLRNSNSTTAYVAVDAEL